MNVLFEADPFEYRVNHKVGRCHVRVYGQGETSFFVVCSARHDTDAPSITNSVEYIANELRSQGHISNAVTWIEHYPEGFFGHRSEESFMVTMLEEAPSGTFRNPTWRESSRDEVVELLRHKV